MSIPVWNFEQEPSDEPLDETGINLRAYFDNMPDEKLRQYNADWTDAQTIEWDANFRDDGNLMLLCCERDVDVREYRRGNEGWSAAAALGCGPFEATPCIEQQGQS